MSAFEDKYSQKGLLRLTTAGSVDDGKSTLIGRLLYDSKSIFEDQLEAIATSSANRGEESVNLALLTDGLKAEREQGITIDVAYRYFTTPKRKFIIADTPGHIQYTRNMVTGASTANLAIILIDARKGISEQTYRHSYIASLLRIPHVVVCVNKMDLVEYDEQVFERIKREYIDFSWALNIKDVRFIPISALKGDNVVGASAATPWYKGPSLLELLETVELNPDEDGTAPRFPVQWVIRPQSEKYPDFRGFAGQVASGVFKVGDAVKVFPSGLSSKIKSIETFDGKQQEARSTEAVVLTLENEIDISRGDLIAGGANEPFAAQEFEATICWFGEKPLQVGGKYAIKHTTREVRAIVKEIVHKININTLQVLADDKTIAANDIGKIRLKTMAPLFVDPYEQNRTTGNFIVVDEATNATVGAGMVLPLANH
jgi:sulfate adenylyltransferase subunit 1